VLGNNYLSSYPTTVTIDAYNPTLSEAALLGRYCNRGGDSQEFIRLIGPVAGVVLIFLEFAEKLPGTVITNNQSQEIMSDLGQTAVASPHCALLTIAATIRVLFDRSSCEDL
jgi:hypothetical protein